LFWAIAIASVRAVRSQISSMEPCLHDQSVYLRDAAVIAITAGVNDVIGEHGTSQAYLW